MKINQILTTGVLGATLAIGFTGCGQSNLKPKTVRNSPTSKSYTFIKTDLSDKNVKSSILNRLNRRYNIYKTTKYYNHERVKIEVDQKEHKINVDIRESSPLCDGHIVFDKTYKLNETKNNIVLTLTNPKNVNFSKDIFYTNLIGSKLCMFEGSTKDAIKAINYLPNKIMLGRSIGFKGEVNSKYSMKSVYANLKRKLKPVSKRYESITPDKMKNKFYLDLDGYTYPTYFTVYPYRNGSKVVYSANLTYSIDSNGNTTLTKEDIKKLHKKIKNIINN